MGKPTGFGEQVIPRKRAKKGRVMFSESRLPRG